MTAEVHRLDPPAPVTHDDMIAAGARMAAGEISEAEWLETLRQHCRHLGEEDHFPAVKAMYLAVKTLVDEGKLLG